jgi:hypothetical protein
MASEIALQKLRLSLRGPALSPGEQAYATAGMLPAAIIMGEA